MSNERKRVLMICPSFPWPATGAEQLDRAEGINQLVRLGYAVVVITKVPEWADQAFIMARAKEIGVRVVIVPYRYSNKKHFSLRERVAKFIGKFRHPLYFDGAAYEYAEPVIRTAVKRELEIFKPDVVWFEYTYLWPLYALAQQAGARIFTRSANFEPKHFLEENGHTFINRLKYLPKWFGEHRTIRLSDAVLAITPQEAKQYQNWGARQVFTLPLRGLPRYIALPRPEVRDRKPLHVFFMGSSYKVAHNIAAVRQVIDEIAPEVQRREPGAFIFHILGGKLSDKLAGQCDSEHVVYEGYVADLNAFLHNMDIALIPSLMGAGMQQKVFEPLTRGIPTITTPRAIAGYPLEAGVEYVAARTAAEFVDALLLLQDAGRRKALARAASAKTAELFAQSALDAIVQKAVYAATHEG